MSDRALTRREEARLLKAGQRALLQGEFPNPDRSGCPDKETLRAIATRKLNLEQVVEWVDHVGFCSPCYVEYDRASPTSCESAMDAIWCHRGGHRYSGWPRDLGLVWRLGSASQ